MYLQIKFLMTRRAFCSFFTYWTNYLNPTDGVAYWAHSSRDIFRSSPNYFLGFFTCHIGYLLFDYLSERVARGGGFEPPSSCEHRISNPTPYQARRPPH